MNAALNALQAWWQGGQLIEFIIALTVLEACALLAYHRLTGKGLQPAQYALNLVAGLCLMLAVDGPVLELCGARALDRPVAPLAEPAAGHQPFLT